MGKAQVTRRGVLAGAAVAAGVVGFPNVIRAQAREVVVGGPGGQEDVTKRLLIPQFEKKHNCKVQYSGAGSLPNLMKIQASRNSPPFDVIMMDETILILGDQEGLLERVTDKKVPNMSALGARSVMRDGAWLTYYVSAMSIGYNTDALPKGLESWSDLWKPQLSGRVLIPHPKTTQAAAFIALAAHLETGLPVAKAQYNIDAAFKKMVAIKPNLLQSYLSSSQASVLVEQGEAWAAAGFFATNTLPRKLAGAPIDLALPKEGSFSMPKGIAKVKNAKSPELADAWIDACLSTEFQEVWMREFQGSPTNTKVTPVKGLIAQADLIDIDWPFFTDRLNELSNRFDREISA